MWIIIHIVKSLSLAESISQELTREGFLVKISPVYRAVSDDENYYQLKVPEGEAAEARQVLMEHGVC